MTDRPNLLPGAFAGTAAAYARYRPPYPEALRRDLVERADVGTDGVLLDLACGPGRVALDLAASFSSVWAIDLEPEMVGMGRQEAARRGIANMRWSVGRAEDLVAPADFFDLITVGEAFHRLDQALIAQNALTWLKPGGCLATLGGVGILDGREPWQVLVAKVAHRWMARAFPGGWGVARAGTQVGRGSQERVIQRAGFVEMTEHTFHAARVWTYTEILGYLQSTSVCSRKALGDDFDAFAAELRGVLLREEPSPTFHETQSFSYTLARKPR